MEAVVEIADPLFKFKWKDSGLYYDISSAPNITIAQTFGIGSEEYEDQNPQASDEQIPP